MNAMEKARWLADQLHSDLDMAITAASFQARDEYLVVAQKNVEEIVKLLTEARRTNPL